MGVSISIAITQNSQSIANNTSNVTVKVTASWTYGSYNAAVGSDGKPQANGWLTIDGTKYTFASKFNTGQTTSGSQTIFTKTVNVTHSSNGTKTLACSASYSTYISAGTVTASASKALTTIARKSTLSVANGTLGTKQTLTVSRQATSLTHTITAACGSASTTICTKSTDTTPDFTPPASWANQNTSGKSVSVIYTITTYSGSTSLGSNSYTKTCAIPSTEAFCPKVSLTVSDALGYASKYGGYVQGRSKIKVVHALTKSYGAEIKTIKTTVDGKNYTASPVTTDIISKSDDVSISVTVTDDRENPGTSSATVNFLPYAVPRISSISAKRCDWTKTDGTVVKNGGLQVTFGAAISALNNINSAAYKLNYKKSSEGDDKYTEVPLTNYAGNYAPSGGVYTFEADTTSSYDIMLLATDDFESVPKYINGPSVNKLFSIITSGIGGWAFGKIAELVGYLDVAFKTLFRDHVEVSNDKSIMGTDTDGETYSALIPVTASGNTSLGHGLYKAEKGHTHIYGNDVQFYTKNGVHFNGSKAYFDNNTTISGTKPDGTVVEAFNPSNVNGNVVIGYDNWELQDGLTNIYGYDINFGISNMASPGMFKPYLRRGDSVDINLHGAGYLTNASTEVHFMIPLSKPIVGTPTITVTSTEGCILRQDNKYTHDSTASVRVYPSSIEAWAYHAVGVRVTMKFTSITNAINNTPIAIDFRGTIEFS